MEIYISDIKCDGCHSMSMGDPLRKKFNSLSKDTYVSNLEDILHCLFDKIQELEKKLERSQ